MLDAADERRDGDPGAELAAHAARLELPAFEGDPVIDRAGAEEHREVRRAAGVDPHHGSPLDRAGKDAARPVFQEALQRLQRPAPVAGKIAGFPATAFPPRCICLLLSDRWATCWPSTGR